MTRLAHEILTSEVADSVRAFRPLELMGVALGAAVGAVLAPAIVIAPVAVVGTAVYYGFRAIRSRREELLPAASRLSMGRRLERELSNSRRISIQDPTTGLLQKWYFDLRMVEEVNRCKRYGVPMALLKIGAKDGNAQGDTWGTAQEWQLAQQVSHCLRAVDISARAGGLEFIACLPHTDLHGAQVAAKRLLDDLNAWSPTVTIASYPADGEDAESLIKAVMTREPVDSETLAEVVRLPARRSYEEIISGLEECGTAEIELAPGETARRVKQSLRRVSKRLGVTLVIWDGDGRVFCKPTGIAATRIEAA